MYKVLRYKEVVSPKIWPKWDTNSFLEFPLLYSQDWNFLSLEMWWLCVYEGRLLFFYHLIISYSARKVFFPNKNQIQFFPHSAKNFAL